VYAFPSQYGASSFNSPSMEELAFMYNQSFLQSINDAVVGSNIASSFVAICKLKKVLSLYIFVAIC
jgi:hypothetical protein